MSAYRRPPLPRLIAGLGAGVACVVLAAGTVACQAEGQASEAGEDGGAGGDDTAGEVAEALDRLLAWEGVTTEASVAAPTEQVYEYLQRTGAATGGLPSANDARRLADMEVTTTTGTPTDNAALGELADSDPLYSAMTVAFGGDDALGLKYIDGASYARVNAAAIAQDVLHGDEADVAEAERFVRNASRLPDALAVPREALAGNWVAVDPFLYDAYAEALTTGETAVTEPDAAEDVTGALTDAGALLTPDAQRAFVDGLREAVGGEDVTYRRGGGERGAEVVELRMPAGEAWRALGPLMTLFAGQAERFGVPPVVAEPTGEAAGRMVTTELRLRNGVLGGVTLDLAQFGPAESADSADSQSSLPPLPLSVTLTGGSALSLTPAAGAVLTADDLTLSLLYLAQEAGEREAAPGRDGLPGPMQPGS
jgi:hypothetical protein